MTLLSCHPSSLKYSAPPHNPAVLSLGNSFLADLIRLCNYQNRQALARSVGTFPLSRGKEGERVIVTSPELSFQKNHIAFGHGLPSL